MQPRNPRRAHIRAVRREIIPEPARPTRAPRRRWASLGAMILLALVAGGGWLLWQRWRAVPEQVLAPVRFGGLQTKVEADGLIVRRERIERAPVAGQVDRLVAQGERVRSGTPVVEIRPGAQPTTAPSPTPSPSPTPVLGPSLGPSQPSLVQREYERLNAEIYRTAVDLNQALYSGGAVATYQAQLDRLTLQQAALLPQLVKQTALLQPTAPQQGVGESQGQAPLQGSGSDPLQGFGQGPSQEPTGAPQQPDPLIWPSAGQHLFGGDGSQVASSMAGVVLYHLDGLEELLVPEAVAQWRPSTLRALPYPDLKELGQGGVAAGAPVFKMVEDLNLELLLVTSAQSLAPAQPADLVDRTVDLQVPGRDQLVQAKVLRAVEEGDQLLIHLSLPLPSAEALRVRRLRVTLLLDRYDGIVVPREAIDLRDGKTGVWVSRGSKFRFTEVRVVGGNRDEVAVLADLAPDDQVLQSPPPADRSVLRD